MIRRSLIALVALGAALALPAAANAYPATTTGNVNLRSGPGTYYSILYTIPYGATVEVYECSGWCRVAYGGYTGYVAASYLSTYRRPRYDPPRYRPRYEPRYEPPRYRPRYNY